MCEKSQKSYSLSIELVGEESRKDQRVRIYL